MVKNQTTELEEFDKAIKAFRIAIEAPKTDLHRDATIQRFEFCVELAWKSAKKIMGSSSSSPKTVVREMAQEGLIESAEKWLEFIDLRNLTVHTYRLALAEEVYQKCKPFLQEVETLYQKLKLQP